MKIIAFNGSPRYQGNTEILLNEALKPIDKNIHQIKYFRLNEMNIKPCQNCGSCEKTGLCIILDDMREIQLSIKEADRVILASPIYFFGLSAQTKTMIDRCQSIWCEKYLLKKEIKSGEYKRKGLLILVGGMKKEEGLKSSEATARAFFRTISIPEHKTLAFLGVDAKGSILNNDKALLETYNEGYRLLEDS